MSYKRVVKRIVPESFLAALRPYFHPQYRFDRRFGVETIGIVEPQDLGIGAANAPTAGGYEATPRTVFRRLIKSLGLDYPSYTFVDMGSGKGAVLLYAAEFPFKEIVGVEFSPALHRIAERNLAAYRGRRKCRNIKALCLNAASFFIPPGPLVLFFFNPFKGHTLQIVSDHIERAIEAEARNVVLIYFHTQSRHPVFDHARRLEIVRREADHTIYHGDGATTNLPHKPRPQP
jgi:SAM-dependent methyltransferase